MTPARSDRAAHHLARTVAGATLAVTLAACGVTEVPTPQTDPRGVWQATAAGVSESSLDLATDGSYERIDAVFSSESCTRERGRWSVDGDRLVLDLETRDGAPASGRESVAFTLSGGTLELATPGAPTSFSRLARMVDCVSYGWGAWEGLLQASIDGVDQTFIDFEVALDVDGGTLTVTSYFSPCVGCPRDGVDLIVEIDGAPGALESGTYEVRNFAGATDTFFGFFHPDPGNPDFQGFSTERLSPPGSFVLSSIDDDRIAATFEFRGNPRADGDVAPDGSTFTLVTDGAVDLTYR